MSSFPDLMEVMEMLAGVMYGSCHIILFRAAVEWIGLCQLALSAPSSLPDNDASGPSDVEVTKSLTPGDLSTSLSVSHQSVFQAIGCLLQYISSVLAALKHVSAVDGRANVDAAHFAETDLQVGDAVDSDGLEEIVPDDDESTAEESVMSFKALKIKFLCMHIFFSKLVGYVKCIV
jgi:hypothetical protein